MNAAGRIERLQGNSPDGKPIAGQRIFVKRHHKYGFGFSISGDSPAYVHSVDKGGPSDGKGPAGLMVGDIILKLGDKSCATARRSARPPSWI